MLSKEEREDALELYETVNEELRFLKENQPRIKELHDSGELKETIILYWEYFDRNSRIGGFELVDTFKVHDRFKRNEFEIIRHIDHDEVNNLWEYEEEFNYLVSKYEELLEKIKVCLGI